MDAHADVAPPVDDDVVTVDGVGVTVNVTKSMYASTLVDINVVVSGSG